MMATLHIEHSITDIETWIAAFQRFEAVRQRSGVRAHRVLRPVDDPHYIVVDLEFETTEAARRFLAFLEREVWATPANSPALVGSPEAKILCTVQNA